MNRLNISSTATFIRTRQLAVFAITIFTFAGLAYAAAPVTSAGQEETANKVQFAADKETITTEQALEEVQKISNDIQKLKTRVIGLNKDLRLMEEKLLFPTSTKYSVFVSMATGQFFDLEGIKFKLDGRFVATHVYSAKQREALAHGGVHRLYVTNLNEGKHEATAFFTGIGSNGRPYKRAISLDFEKSAGSDYLQIAVSDNGATQEPVFELKQW